MTISVITFAGYDIQVTKELEEYLNTYNITYLYLARLIEYYSEIKRPYKITGTIFYNIDMAFRWADTPEGRDFWSEHEDKLDTFKGIIANMGGD